MKCLKCGREMDLKRNIGGACKGGVHYVKDEKHQQRLDNVLSKFELKGGYYTLSPNGINIYYNANNNNGRFMLYGKYDNQRSVISLDTVESLIKDLEGTDEK